MNRLNIEWLDDSSNLMVYKIEVDNNRLTKGSVLTVRESQVAIFTDRGRVADVFGPGGHKLSPEKLPLLSRFLNWVRGFDGNFKSDLFFVSTRQFTNRLWGTPAPVTIRDRDYGAVRVKGNGSYSFKVEDAALFMKELFGTNSTFVAEEIEDWLADMVVMGITNAIGTSGIPFLDLAGNLMELSRVVEKTLSEDFKKIGLKLVKFVCKTLVLPEDLQKKLDESTGLAMINKNIGAYTAIAQADALKIAAGNTGAGSAFMQAGMGAAMGNMLGGMLAQQQMPQQQALGKESDTLCSSCGAPMGNMLFCGKCGAKKQELLCPQCKTPFGDMLFCGKCGTKRS